MAFSFSRKRGIDKIRVTKSEYLDFPSDFNSITRVLGYYQKYIFEGRSRQLNKTQRALTYYYLVDGMINNSGVFSILLESLGKYNNG